MRGVRNRPDNTLSAISATCNVLLAAQFAPAIKAFGGVVRLNPQLAQHVGFDGIVHDGSLGRGSMARRHDPVAARYDLAFHWACNIPTRAYEDPPDLVN
jgi:hypothetical protein